MLCPRCGKTLSCDRVTFCKKCRGDDETEHVESEFEDRDDTLYTASDINDHGGSTTDSEPISYRNAGFWVRVGASIVDSVFSQVSFVVMVSVYSERIMNFRFFSGVCVRSLYCAPGGCTRYTDTAHRKILAARLRADNLEIIRKNRSKFLLVLAKVPLMKEL
jgi:hypothetical protein